MIRKVCRCRFVQWLHAFFSNSQKSDANGKARTGERTFRNGKSLKQWSFSLYNACAAAYAIYFEMWKAKWMKPICMRRTIRKCARVSHVKWFHSFTVVNVFILPIGHQPSTGYNDRTEEWMKWCAFESHVHNFSHLSSSLLKVRISISFCELTHGLTGKVW